MVLYYLYFRRIVLGQRMFLLKTWKVASSVYFNMFPNHSQTTFLVRLRVADPSKDLEAIRRIIEAHGSNVQASLR